MCAFGRMSGWVLSPLTFVLLLQVVALVSFGYKKESQLYTGDRCTLENGGGVCTEVLNCNSALMQIKQGIHPPLCYFDKHNPIVCCPHPQQEVVVQVQPPNIGQTSPANIGQQSEKLVQLQPSNISETKCVEYTTPKTNVTLPSFKIAIVGGVFAFKGEFPHMAALGFGTEKETRWLCGGALISPNFVLTAAHCLHSREYGAVKWVRLGDLNLYNGNDDSSTQQFTVVQSIPHPNWIASQSYNDIALLKLDRDAEINFYVKIACLHVAENVDDPFPVATGWGKTQFLGDRSDNLMKVSLQYFGHQDCSKTYPVSKDLPNGLVEKTQLCAGSATESKDTCQGDSGGPLQYTAYLASGTPLMRIAGITSFGKGCGIVNTPAVYTRVSAFVPWIESIVWKD